MREDKKLKFTTKVVSKLSTLKSNDKSSDLSTINNTNINTKNNLAKYSLISKNTSAGTLHFKKQISPSPNVERSIKNIYTPLLSERSELFHLHSTELTMTSNSIRGSFLNNDINYNKVQEENKKYIDFTSKIIDSISKLKSFLTFSGKEYNLYVDKIQRNTLSKSNFDILYNYIDVIHEGASDLKNSFSTINTIEVCDDITFDSTKINKNNIKVSSERRLNIYKKLFDICKDSFSEVSELILNLISEEEIVRDKEINRNSLINSYQNVSQNCNFIEGENYINDNLNFDSLKKNSVKREFKSDNNLIILNGEKIEYLGKQSKYNDNNIIKSFFDEAELNDEECTTFNENANIKSIPTKVTNVNKPKETHFKFNTISNYKCDDNLKRNSKLSKFIFDCTIMEDINEGDTVNEYGNNSFLKKHTRSRSQIIKTQLSGKEVRSE